MDKRERLALRNVFDHKKFIITIYNYMDRNLRLCPQYEKIILKMSLCGYKLRQLNYAIQRQINSTIYLVLFGWEDK